MALEAICLTPTEPPSEASDDELWVAQGACPGCELPTAFVPDDLAGELGALTCRYCNTRFVVALDGRSEMRQDKLRERLMGTESRRVLRVDRRRTRVEPPARPDLEIDWTTRKAAMRRRIEERKRRQRDSGPA